MYVTLLYVLQDETDTDGQAIDSRGIAGWEVDHLARTLLKFEGIFITNTQAKEIKTLYSELLEFDKWPITFQLRPVNKTRQRFARTKNRVGNETINATKR